jgi:peptidoglycan-associated lipoprotein
MRKGVYGFLVVLCGGVLLLNGCAKEELVKKDEPIAPPPPAAAAQPPKKQEPIKAEVVQSQPIKEAPATAQAQAQAARETVAAQAPERSLERIYFDFDSSTLSQAARDTLYANAEYLLKKYKGPVKLEGHCDERGSDEYNLALGEKRAKSAFNYLMTLGVPTERLSVISYGKEKPADPGHDEAAWAKNRRVEFVIVK